MEYKWLVSSEHYRFSASLPRLLRCVPALHFVQPLLHLLPLVGGRHARPINRLVRPAHQQALPLQLIGLGVFPVGLVG